MKGKGVAITKAKIQSMITGAIFEKTLPGVHVGRTSFVFQGSLRNPFLQSLQYEVRGTRLTVLLSRSTENLGGNSMQQPSQPQAENHKPKPLVWLRVPDVEKQAHALVRPRPPIPE